MSHVMGTVMAVPTAQKDAYIAMSHRLWPLFQAAGAVDWRECWGDMVPDGELTSFPKAVQKAEDETVVMAWIEFRDKASAEACMEAMDSAPEWQTAFADGIPFDGKRMIWGLFDVVARP
ncbi:MAG: DUF1428 domain-containing protein [Pseudomonadota bacterium]